MTRREQGAFWLAAFLAFVALLWLLQGILLPFVAAMAIAYMLDPLADQLEQLRMRRTPAAAIVLALFLAVVVGVLLLITPLVQAQVTKLIEQLPEYAKALADTLEPVIERINDRMANGEGKELPGIGEVAGWLAGVLKGIWSGGAIVIDTLSLLVITPIVTFYLLRDWDDMVAKVDSWLPRAQVPTIRRLALEIDETLAGFVRGQGLVCLILGSFYAAALTALGLEFGLVIGIVSGLITFVPFVGAFVGGLLSIGFALLQFETWWWVVAVGFVFAFGQFVEGNILTPRLVGGAVGLHPVWVIFALLAGGSLFGFLGVLVAVPVAAVIGVLARYWISRYLGSPLHDGVTRPSGVPKRGREP